MNHNDLEKIIAIAEDGSMAKAAARLYISQPALSKCLTKVEEELGEPLFNRRPTGLTLTFAGECLVQKAYQILHLYDDLEMDFCDLNQMRKGVLRVGTTRALSAIVLPEALSRFRMRYPNIRIDIIEENSLSLEKRIALGSLDMAIVCLPVQNSTLQTRVFYQDPLLIAVPKVHPLNEKGYVVEGERLPFMPLDALRGQKLILTGTENKTRLAAGRALEKLDGDFSIALESHNMESVIRFVGKGIGVSIVPSVFAQNYLREDEVNYYRMEEGEEVFYEWAVTFGSPVSELSRPSRELYHILCEENCIFPDFLG